MAEETKPAEPVKAVADGSPVLGMASNRFAAEYAKVKGIPVTAIPPELIALFMQLLTSLLGGCLPKPALAFAKNRPKLLYVRAWWTAYGHTSETGEAIDPAAFAGATVATAQSSNDSEMTAFMAAVPKMP